MGDPVVDAMLTDARNAMTFGATRREAEEQYRVAIAWATDMDDVWRGCREAAELAANAEDFARARRWLNAARIRLSGKVSPELMEMVSSLDGMWANQLDAGTFTPPRKTSPTLPPSRPEGFAVADGELATALSREYGPVSSGGPTPDPDRRSAALEMVDGRPPMYATICGRAVLDDRGRVGILDLTTGHTTLIDYLYDDHVAHDAARGLIVVANGMLTGAGTDRKALRVEQYRGERGYGHPWTMNDARAGLTINDPLAQRVVNGDGAGPGLA